MVWWELELSYFVHLVFRGCASQLALNSIKIPSGQYEQKLKLERTQADLVKEMEQELASLPRFIVWAKIINDKGMVVKNKIKNS